MTAIDLSHRITQGMPVYPGTLPPTIEATTTIERDGFAEKRISMFTHTGTHMDAPAHILPGAETLDHFAVDRFLGKGTVINVSGGQPSIGLNDLLPHEGRIRRSAFMLLYTGWARFWGSQAYFGGFPVLTEEAARWLCEFQLKGIGVDALSIDPVDAPELRIHTIVLSRGMVIIENLVNLESLIGQDFQLCCLPLKIADADGSPVRAIAITGSL